METLPESSGPGSVVLEIGGDVGAATVRVDPSLAGREIEIREVGAPWAGRHVAVLRRDLPDGPVWAALFPSLTEGDYEVRVIGEPGGLTITLSVIGARVTSATLSSADAMPSSRALR
jgi:hypothetical protein